MIDRFAREFMVVHRVSRVLRKCGQYQDLMLLSEGDDLAFTYCDWEHYGSDARPYSEPLFHNSEDVNNIFGRKFDYTLVLDGDTGVPDGCVYELLSIAAANPERGIDHSRKNPALVSFICHYFYISTFSYKTNQIIKHIFLNKKKLV